MSQPEQRPVAPSSKPAQPNSKLAQPSSKPAQPSSKQVMSTCPQCSAALVVLRIIPGKAGAEYWTMRCTKCGGIHLDIIKADSPVAAAADSNNVFL